MKNSQLNKIILLITIVLLLPGAYAIDDRPAPSYEQQRYYPNCSIFSNPMSNMGMGMFNMMSGMPFFGGGVRRMGSMMASQMLNNPQMAHDMVFCAIRDPQMVGIMMKMLRSSNGLLNQITSLIYRSPTLAEGLIDLALIYRGVAPFLFARLNPSLYHALSYAMSKSPSLTKKMMRLLDQHAEYVLHSGTPFWNIFFYLGHEDSFNDGSEISNERFLQAVFSDIDSAAHFVKIINNRVDKSVRSQLLNFVLLGQRPAEFVYNLHHPKQAYLFNYAMIKGMASSVIDLYDHDDMPNRNSENPANALLGELMIEMVDLDSDADVMQLSNYGKIFISALTHAQESGDEEGTALYELMNMIIPLEIFEDQLPTRDENTPLPRNLTTLPLF
ncbi:MAG: hypothetical protein HN353_10050 [Bdellovibrionales bacterium]|jgi:hypothetical protein|nr:hypothetical protein [Bdellovibrionales bacterium]MBT3527242.1 hypothetical protein [Bdellovibrionales bacterium]MBT7670616.1 hypothetical protein [Bdellovibrionales bacterium]MBT7767691.1 hypothetical protein [Bdellovibrionales bacterium]